jgi:hypothetical protein
VDSKRYSLLCAIGNCGIIYWELIDTTKEGINGESFIQYLENLVAIVANYDATLYLGNARIHKVCGVMVCLRHSMFLIYSVHHTHLTIMPLNLFSCVKLKIKDKRFEIMTLRDSIMFVMNELDDEMEDQEKTTADLCKSWIDYAVRHWESDAV